MSGKVDFLRMNRAEGLLKLIFVWFKADVVVEGHTPEIIENELSDPYLALD